jgi:uncharacterized HAD superfamily protein
MDRQIAGLMLVAIDIDAVVADTNRRIIDRLNSEFGLELELADMDRPDFVENYPGLSLRQRHAFARALFGDPAFYRSLIPVKDAAHHVALLRRNGFRIVYVTARPISTLNVTRRWLATHGLLPPNTLVLHPGPHEPHLEFKVGVARQFPLECFVEDRLETARILAPLPVILFDYPYNRGRLRESTIRVYSWAEAYQAIRLLKPGMRRRSIDRSP